MLVAARNEGLTTKQALKEIGQRVRGELNDRDREKLATGAVRWINKCQWARDEMVKAGLMYPKEAVGRGIWKLTEAGAKYQVQNR